MSLTGIRKFAAHVTPVMLVEGVGIEDARKPFHGLFLEKPNPEIQLDCAKAEAIDLGCFCVSTAEKEGVLRHLHDEEVKIGGLAGGRMCGVRPPGMLTGEDTQSSVVGQTLAGGTVMSGPGAATTADRLRMWMPDARIGVAMCAAGPGSLPEPIQGRSCLGDEEVKEVAQAAQTTTEMWKGGDPRVKRTGRGSRRAADRGAEKGRMVQRTSLPRFGRSRPPSIRSWARRASGMQVHTTMLLASGRTPRLKRLRRLIPSKRLPSLPCDRC